MACTELAWGSAKELPLEKQTCMFLLLLCRVSPSSPLLGAGRSWWEGFLSVSKNRTQRACEEKALDLGRQEGGSAAPGARGGCSEAARVCAGGAEEEEGEGLRRDGGCRSAMGSRAPLPALGQALGVAPFWGATFCLSCPEC